MMGEREIIFPFWTETKVDAYCKHNLETNPPNYSAAKKLLNSVYKLGEKQEHQDETILGLTDV